MNYLDVEKQEYLEEKQGYFPTESFDEVRNIIINSDSQTFEKILKADFKNPGLNILWAAAIGFMGFDRIFLFKDKTKGLLKVLTWGGFGVWYIIDILTAPKRSKEWNLNKIRAVVGGAASDIGMKQKFENLKNNKELQKTLISDGKKLWGSLKELGDSFH